MRKIKAEKLLREQDFFDRQPEAFSGAYEPLNETKPKKTPSHKLRGRVVTFVNAIILLCLLMCIVITLTVLWDYHRLDLVLSAGEILALLGMWGGELLLIVVRQVLGSDIGKRKNSDEEGQ